MTLFPFFTLGLESLKGILQLNSAFAGLYSRYTALELDMLINTQHAAAALMQPPLSGIASSAGIKISRMLDGYAETMYGLMDWVKSWNVDPFEVYRVRREEEVRFLEILTQTPPEQKWNRIREGDAVLCDLPGHRLIDISAPKPHKVKNYTVVFAPRAGHHSNIAERVAFYLRENGLTRIAVVEQKCADDIPLYVDGNRHLEGFESQVEQYRLMLEKLMEISGHPSHLIAVCQPGPLLMTTLILYPHLGATFGSAGSPMHTEAQTGTLTDFARIAGEGYIDGILNLLGNRVSDDKEGRGRAYYDGRFQVFGFYCLGIDQHHKNFIKLFNDLREGKTEEVERQKIFYQWYNYVHHAPAGFIRDTFKKIFIKNELIRGTLQLGGTTVGISQFPPSVPIWALGGEKDDIAPPGQAVGHMKLITSVPMKDKLTLLSPSGHMGLFRSKAVLKQYYNQIAEFILSRSRSDDSQSKE
jgi:polyhydroxyalkanoate depolymerase